MNFKKPILLFILFGFPCFSISAQIDRIDNVVGSTFTFHSEIMNDDREIQVFLPESYKDSSEKYPVLYILDGQRYFLNGVSLQKSFVEFKQTPEFIVVGISKKRSDRNRNFSSNSRKYLNYIEKEVVTYIDTEFRTSEKRMLFGWAYGGGFVLETMINKPNLFSVYIAASPFPIQEKINKIDSLLTDRINFNRQLYISAGTNEGIVTEDIKALITLLKNKALKTMHWTFKEFEGEEHRSTPFTTLYHGIKNHYNYYTKLQFSTLDDFFKAGGLTYVYDYYKQRALQFGFPNKLSDWTMFSLTRNAIRANDYDQFDILVTEFNKTRFLVRLRESRASLVVEFYLQNKQYDKAIQLFNSLIEKHPSSSRILNGLGNSHKALGNKKRLQVIIKKQMNFQKRTRIIADKKHEISTTNDTIYTVILFNNNGVML